MSDCVRNTWHQKVHIEQSATCIDECPDMLQARLRRREARPSTRR